MATSTRIPTILSAAAALLYAVFSASLATAQVNQPDQPDQPKPNADTLSTQLVLFEAYDQNILQTVSLLEPAFATAGFYTTTEGRVDYLHRARRATLTFGAEGRARYYPDLDSSVADRYDGYGQLESHPFVHTTLDIGGYAYRHTSFSSAPVWQFERLNLPILAVPGFNNERFAQTPANEVSGHAVIVQQLATHTDFSLDYSRGRGAWADVDFNRQSAGARFRHRLSESLRFNLGYDYYEMDFDSELQSTHFNTVDGGVDYTHKFGVQTEAAVSIGAAIAPEREQSGGGGNRRARLTGQASIHHLFNRAWSGDLGYSRGIHYRDGIPKPLSFDEFEAGMTGRFSTKLTASASASYAWGEPYYSPIRHPYDSFIGQARLTYAMSPAFDAFAGYQLYEYNFSDPALLPAGVPGVLGRNAALVGVTLRARTAIRQ